MGGGAELGEASFVREEGGIGIGWIGIEDGEEIEGGWEVLIFRC